MTWLSQITPNPNGDVAEGAVRASVGYIMKSDNPQLHFTLINPEFFDTLDHYNPTREFIEPVRAICGDRWTIIPRGYWCHCNPGSPLGVQGWKIHIAGTPHSALTLLSRIVPICVKERLPFKFCSDLRMVRFSVGKGGSRISGGKFITIYPPSDNSFRHAIQACYEATEEFTGPYIITDYPYRDSKVVFYRYGEHMGIGGVDANGRRVRAILSPNNTKVMDKREPLAPVPDWLPNPFGSGRSKPAKPTEFWLRNQRYRVTGARRYSNFGGIYLGEDTESGRSVIVREARPYLGDSKDPREPQNLLRKQARIMDKMRPTGLVPDFIDLFDEQGHLFLIEEMLHGNNLWGYALSFGHFVPTVDSSRLDRIIFYSFRALVEGLVAFHEHQIILRDLTKSNVYFTDDGHIKFIDFEFAFESDRNDPPLPGGTEGYMSPEQRISAPPTVAEDYYALGALLLDLIAFTGTGLFLNSTGVLAALRQTLRDLGLPACYVDAVSGLTAPKPENRLHPIEALRMVQEGKRPWTLADEHFEPSLLGIGTSQSTVLDHEPAIDSSLPSRECPSQELRQEIRTTIDGITSYIRSALRPLSEDILWPPSPEVFATNPVSLSFGASGIVCYLNRVGESIPTGVVPWIIERSTPDTCSPGLYIGLSGVALCLLQIGRVEEGEAILQRSSDLERVLESPGLYHGAAGWALANVVFWRKTGRRLYLDRALEIGWHLLRSARHSAQGIHWESDSGVVGYGLAYGASGIATLMTCLNTISPENRFLEAAAGAIDYEMANARWNFGRILWTDVKSTSPQVPLFPHTRFGASGVGTAAIRVYAATGEPRFRRAAELCAFTASCRLGNKLWQDWGLSGLGEFILDMFHYLSDEVYLNTAYYLAEAILPHRLYKPQGIAFAGAELLRISCAFGMGSAGIGWFLHRVLNPEAPRLLFPHELFEAPPGSAAYRN
jgi:serine/threonine protein kinase